MKWKKLDSVGKGTYYAAAVFVVLAFTTTVSLLSRDRDSTRSANTPGRSQSSSGQMATMPASGPGMMMMAAPGPAMMLFHQKELGLDAAQVRQLEGVAAVQEENMQKLMPLAMRAMADLMEAASGEINVEAARVAHDKMARAHTEMLVTNLKAMKDAQQILKPEQRRTWMALTAQMGGMMSMLGPMMMGPMKMGSM